MSAAELLNNKRKEIIPADENGITLYDSQAMVRNVIQDYARDFQTRLIITPAVST